MFNSRHVRFPVSKGTPGSNFTIPALLFITELISDGVCGFNDTSSGSKGNTTFEYVCRCAYVLFLSFTSGS